MMREKEEALKAKDLSTIEMRQTFEVLRGRLRAGEGRSVNASNGSLPFLMQMQSARMLMFDRERDSMLQSIKKLQKEVERAGQEKEQHDAEMRVLLVEMDRQKARMEEKIGRLKAAISD
ncbi:hypothetical protein BDK51DRAFT_26632 [Blyttiomyces helicus]|uniref:Uncharacterized protein n=1 Tax=Blyttiomyces helicus TaxID=388810 RepID=A0A4P9W8G4_9FUNG|nr:hypothetical protein BDK51DRAFT_26632 [Blyttiomyces helicus]|eukprot:RKO87090.1 hypothetical protein BDK51DRAFT_26632 [Blyttiomyces helicus]